MPIKATNQCGSGFCSCKITIDAIRSCISSMEDNWNGLCAYQDGLPVEARKTTNPKCRNCQVGGCEMSAEQFANWNGLCAYN